MRKILLMAKRDYIASVRTKSFIIGLVVAPLLFGGGGLGVALLNKKTDLRDRRIAVLDRTGLVAPSLLRAAAEKNAKEAYHKVTHAQTAALYVLEAVAPSPGDPDQQRLALSDRVRSRELFAFLEIWPQALHPGQETKPPARAVAFYTNAGGIDLTRNWLREPLNRAVRSAQLAQLGVDGSHFEDLLAPVPIDPLNLLMRDPLTGALQQAKKKDEVAEFAAPFGMMFLLMMIVMIGTAPMLSGVTEDKNQRIFEMLLGLVTPTELMAWAHPSSTTASAICSSARIPQATASAWPSRSTARPSPRPSSRCAMSRRRAVGTSTYLASAVTTAAPPTSASSRATPLSFSSTGSTPTTITARSAIPREIWATGSSYGSARQPTSTARWPEPPSSERPLCSHHSATHPRGKETARDTARSG